MPSAHEPPYMSEITRHIEKIAMRLLESRIFWAFLTFSTFVANAIWCARNRLAGDVSFYLYAIQRIRDGAVMYRDFYDMNLPIVYMLHLPLAWFNQWFGLRIDLLLYSAIWTVVLGMLLYVWHMPRASALMRGFLVFCTAFASLSLNRFQTGQRDPLCAFLFVGLVLAVYERMQQPEGRSTALSWVGVLAASIGMAMKPHFLLPWAVFIAALAWTCGLKAALRMKETWLPILVSVVSWAVTLAAFPLFLSVVAMASRYYGVVLVSPYEFSPLIVPLTPIVIALLRKPQPGGGRPLSWFAGLAGFAFAIEAVTQMKGFPYHQTPCMFWAMMTTGLLLIEWFERRATQPRLGLWIPACVTIASSLFLVWFSFWTAVMAPPKELVRTDLDDFVVQHARGKTVLNLSTDVRTSFPLVLEAGAFNPLPFTQLWAMGGLYREQVKQAEGAPEPVQARYHARAEMSADERKWFDDVIDVIVTKHPAVIFVQTSAWKWGLDNLKFDFVDYFSTDERFRQAMRSYHEGPATTTRKVLVFDGIDVARRGP